jgi:haloacetate dehalogenase
MIVVQDSSQSLTPPDHTAGVVHISDRHQPNRFDGKFVLDGSEAERALSCPESSTTIPHPDRLTSPNIWSPYSQPAVVLSGRPISVSESPGALRHGGDAMNRHAKGLQYSNKSHAGRSAASVVDAFSGASEPDLPTQSENGSCDFGRRTWLLAAAGVPALAAVDAALSSDRSAQGDREAPDRRNVPRPASALRLPGFDYKQVATSSGTINVATRGKGAPLLLLHGYPETHFMWHAVAPALAEDFAVVCADLRGYGDSSKPEGLADHSNYSKRAMATDMVEVMASLGYHDFMVAGHDRGARVGYRLALDYPTAITRLALLDIVSTKAIYEQVSVELATAYFHWYFLIQPRPLPETLLGHDPNFWLSVAFRRFSRNPGAFADATVAEYLRTFGTPEGIHATCEDYRAGASVDLSNDRADASAGRKITCPTLILWGTLGVIGRLFQPLETWRDFVATPTGHAIDCGHFIPEEKPAETLQSLRTFFRS